MGFSNPITGGQGALVRPAIKSPNYAAGSTGWTVNQDGSAEFNSLSLRGSEVLGDPATAHIVLNGSTGQIQVYDSSGTLVATIDSGGISMANGSNMLYVLPTSPPRIAFAPAPDTGHTYSASIVQAGDFGNPNYNPYLEIFSPVDQGIPAASDANGAQVFVIGQSTNGQPSTIDLRADQTQLLPAVNASTGGVLIDSNGRRFLPSNVGNLNTTAAGQNFTVATKTAITNVSFSFTKLYSTTRVLVQMTGGGYSTVGTGYGISYGITVQGGTGDLTLGVFNFNTLNEHHAWSASNIFTAAWAAGTFTVNGWIAGSAGNTMRSDGGDTWSITLTEIV